MVSATPPCTHSRSASHWPLSASACEADEALGGEVVAEQRGSTGAAAEDAAVEAARDTVQGREEVSVRVGGRKREY